LHWQIYNFVDSYENVQRCKWAHDEVINMLDGEALDRIVAKHKPDFIVPEMKHSHRTFYDYENKELP
jgi:phosphoribosylglycinamide formyltransferase 2